MRRLSRDTRRRLALYGGATLVAILVLAVPPLLRSAAPPIEVAAVDIQDLRSREATRLLREYVWIDSSNPPEKTVKTARFWAEKLGCEGIPFEIVGSDPERPIVVARLAGRRQGEALLLLHHMDVTPAGDLSKWDHPPFGGEYGTGMFQNYLCGRGTIDMKGQGIADFLAIASLRRDGIVAERDLVFVAEPGEETLTPEIGLGWVVDHRPDLLAGVTDVFNEGGVNEVSGDRVLLYGIEVLQKAAIMTTAEADREEDLKAFSDFLDARMAAEPYQVLDEVQDFLSFVAPFRSDLWGHGMEDMRTALRENRFLVELPEPYKALMRDMYYVGKPLPAPDGKGFTTNVVATLLPGRSARGRWSKLQAWAARYRVRLRLRHLTPDSAPTPRTGRAWETLLTVLSLDPVEHAEVGTYVLTGSYTNSSYLRLRGLRAFGVSPFAVNIYDARTVDHDNERIFLPAYIDGVERTARIVREYALAP